MPRCCEPVPREFEPCYASVALLGTEGLAEAVARAEGGLLEPCVTAWCARCRRPYLLTTDLAAFPSASAHHAHQLALLERLRRI